MTFRCHRCDRQLSLETLLDSAPGYQPALSLVTLCCPHDRATVVEVQLDDARLVEGYTYAAGALHFSAEREHHIAGLAVEREGRALRVRLGRRSWHLSAA